jgi:hypothetical protein
VEPNSCRGRATADGLTADELMSRPTTDLIRSWEEPHVDLPPLRSRSAVVGPHGVRAGLRRRGTEDLVLVGDPEREREQDLALGIQAARPPRLDAVDRERREARLPRQLRLAQHQRFAELLDVVARHRSPSGVLSAPAKGGARHGLREYR